MEKFLFHWFIDSFFFFLSSLSFFFKNTYYVLPKHTIVMFPFKNCFYLDLDAPMVCEQHNAMFTWQHWQSFKRVIQGFAWYVINCCEQIRKEIVRIIFNSWIYWWGYREHSRLVGCVNFHCMQMSLVMSMRFVSWYDLNGAPFWSHFGLILITLHAQPCACEKDFSDENVSAKQLCQIQHNLITYLKTTNYSKALT